MSNTTVKATLLERLFGAKAPPAPALTAEQIQTWLVNRLAAHLEVAPADIDVREAFNDYGLDSRTAVSLSGELERLLDRRLPATLVWDYPTIEAVAKHLADGGDGTAPEPAMDGDAA